VSRLTTSHDSASVYHGPVVPDPTYWPGPPPTTTSAQSAPHSVPDFDSLPYHRLFRAGRGRSWVWGPLVGMPLVALFMVGIAPLGAVGLVMGWLALQGKDVGAVAAAMASVVDNPTPLGLALVFLSLSLMIPVIWLLVRVIHGLKPGWTTSVRPRFRWGLFAVALAASFIAMFARVLVSAALLPVGSEEIPTTELVPWSNTVRDFLLIIFLLTPFQAAAEEYVFRGYLTQAFGGWFGAKLSRVVAVLGPALLFAIAHGLNQDLPVFFDRFAFGVVAGILVQITGGLEAGIAAHILNNVASLGIAVAFGLMEQALEPQASSYWMIVSTLVHQLTFLALMWAWVKMRRVQTYADGRVLAASRGLV
jgi:uncharacterized protein